MHQIKSACAFFISTFALVVRPCFSIVIAQLAIIFFLYSSLSFLLLLLLLACLNNYDRLPVNKKNWQFFQLIFKMQQTFAFSRPNSSDNIIDRVHSITIRYYKTLGIRFSFCFSFEMVRLYDFRFKF